MTDATPGRVQAPDDSRQRAAIQTAILVELDTRTRIYPEFAQVDRRGEVPVVTAVTLMWDEFVALATPHLSAPASPPIQEER